MSKILIGLHGLKGSGKDTAAEALVGGARGYVQLSFAAPMKRMLAGLFDWDMGYFEDFEWKETRMSDIYNLRPRDLLQTLGTEWGRNLVNESIWLDAAMRDARFYDKIVFSDVRFPNEAQRIRDEGGFVIRIIRDGHTAIADAHPSDAELPGELIDFTITAQSGDIEGLQRQVQQFAIGIEEAQR